tara:strand:+ start:943 stop:1251 length:309 start_codon:yes stop_codon:yes gene_type:complete
MFEKGFTLLELLTMFCIMCALVSIALSSFLEQKGKSDASAPNYQGKQLVLVCQLESVGASLNYTNIEANLQIAQTFGSINWIPTLTGQACGEVTTGEKTLQG